MGLPHLKQHLHVVCSASLRSSLVCSQDGKCPCSCNVAVDVGCNCRDLQGTISISVTKSPVALLYPITYLKTVNFYPIEKVQYTNNCNDNALVDSPTCGWYYRDGIRVPDSQARRIQLCVACTWFCSVS